MLLPFSAETMTKEQWELLFGAYVKVNHSHWTGAPYEVVLDLLKKHSRYQFGFNAMGTWHSKFLLTVKDGALDVEFVKNTELPPRMKEHVEKMEKTFYEEVQQLS